MLCELNKSNTYSERSALACNVCRVLNNLDQIHMKMLHPNDFQKLYTGLMKVTGGKVRACAFFFCSWENCCCCWPWRFFRFSLSARVLLLCLLCCSIRVHFVLLWHDLRLYNGWAAAAAIQFFSFLRSPPAAAMALHHKKKRTPFWSVISLYIYVCVVCISSNQRPASCCDCWARPQICAIPPAQHLFHLSSSN